MYPKEQRSRQLYSDSLPCFSRKQHRESFEVFLDLLPERASVKFPSALSHFLNHAAWDTRQLCLSQRVAAQVRSVQAKTLPGLRLRVVLAVLAHNLGKP
ncbi:hypothetical protein DAETH_30390 [Deinococcus aetherius]|uniref:HD domain-containing protein n=1 Tax=Deinococcus aetherius TaxID=200252 RepID=A0ABM8AGZ2_9DEIO|nr:hypothetical protein DAETH_30390 [Deinococcus aetherius]